MNRREFITLLGGTTLRLAAPGRKGARVHPSQRPCFGRAERFRVTDENDRERTWY